MVRAEFADPRVWWHRGFPDARQSDIHVRCMTSRFSTPGDDVVALPGAQQCIGGCVLELQLFSVHRGGRRVVRRASLSVDSPGLLFIVGASGAGKSSLLAALAGGDPEEVTHSGTARLDGKELGVAGSRAAWVTQHEQLLEEGTLAANLAVLLHLPPRDLPAWLHCHALDDIVSRLGESCALLPPSLRRLLAVLAGLHFEAPLVLVDEPEAGLIEPHVACIRTRLGELSTRCMVVVATQDHHACQALQGHTALLAGGAIRAFAHTG